MEDNQEVDKYIEYVNDSLEKVKKYSLDLHEGSETLEPSEINYLLANYEKTHWVLIAEYQRRKKESQILKRRHQVWFDRMYFKSREILNPATLPGTKWCSKEEINSHVRFTNKEEFLTQISELETAENKERFMLRILDAWKGFDTILVNLSLNMRSEMKALSLENRINRGPMNRERKRLES